MNDLRAAIADALRYCDDNGVEIPIDILLSARVKGIKAGNVAGDLSSINSVYHDRITKILTDYFEGGNLRSLSNAFKRAVIESFGSAFDQGWMDGGQELPVDDTALTWFKARVEEEFGHVEMLFQQAKELRGEEGFDFFEWVSARADGYTNTLKELYNAGRLRAMKDQMVTFDGDDGEESCPDCQRLKGSRHKISWFVKRNYVPPFGTGLECHPGGRCQHGLMDDGGNWVTV